MPRPIEEVMKKVGLSESSVSSKESTDSKSCLMAQVTSTGIIDLYPDFEGGLYTVVVNDILEGVVRSERSKDLRKKAEDQILVWDSEVYRVEVASIDRGGGFCGW
ncbi:hypothetical protein ACOSP7_004647 [Xanthoceras sorbifolium]